MGKKSNKGKEKKLKMMQEAAREKALKALVSNAMFTEDGGEKDVLADFIPFTKYAYPHNEC